MGTETRRSEVGLGVVVLALAMASGCGSGKSEQGYPADDGGGISSGSGSGSSGSGSGSGSGGNVLGDGGVSSSSGGGAGCAQGAEFVYVVDVNGTLYQFNPPTIAFTTVGQVTCAGNQFFSMAIDRNAVAWVLAQDGSIVKYDINAKTCAKTSYQIGQQGFQTFGMGFSANGAGASTDTLFVTDDELTAPGTNRGLASIDTSSLLLKPVAQYDQLKGEEAELTGTGDGRLYGAFEGSPYTVAEIDKSTGHIISVAPQTGINYAPSSSSLAFAFWGGDFWLFIGPGGTTDVFQYQPSAHTTTKRETEQFEIVGAGVSTCAPTTPPQ
jgi:hypothetical protein